MKDEFLGVLIAFSNEFFAEESKTITLKQLIDFIDRYTERDR